MPAVYKLRTWRISSAGQPLVFYTCGRPGRGKNSLELVLDKKAAISLRALQDLGGDRPTVLVSLLGTKSDGSDEFRLYSFKNASGFRGFVKREAPAIVLIEHPTVDYLSIPRSALDDIAADIRVHLASHTVVVMDSGGQERCKAVCKHLRAVEHFATGF